MRIKRTAAAALAMAAIAVATTSAPAQAAGAVGPYQQSTCTYYMQSDGLMFDKIAVAVWPSVAAYSSTAYVDKQYIYAKFVWYERQSSTNLTAVQTDWRWTYAADNAYTKTWYTFGTNQPGVAVTKWGGYDASAAGAYPDVFLQVSLYWYTGSTVTGSTSYWAPNPSNSNNGYVCNGGQPYTVVY